MNNLNLSAPPELVKKIVFCAEVRGRVIDKRKRKSRYYEITMEGDTKEEAIFNLKYQYQYVLGRVRSAEFKEVIIYKTTKVGASVMIPFFPIILERLDISVLN